jgi:hypothetical protein
MKGMVKSTAYSLMYFFLINPHLFVWFLVEDGDPQVHEGHGEIHPLFPLVCDGNIRHHQVSLLVQQLAYKLLIFN